MITVFAALSEEYRAMRDDRDQTRRERDAMVDAYQRLAAAGTQVGLGDDRSSESLSPTPIRR